MKTEPIPMGFWKIEWDKDNTQERKEEVLAKVAPMTTLEKSSVLVYMGRSSILHRYRGMAACRVCGTHLGNADMLTPDGLFTFPQCWDHYILEHVVRPDDAFVEAAKKWIEA